MSNFTLDHIFCFCDSQATREIESAGEAGFSIYPGNIHPGQGTANRAILFEDNYLEFIFLESPDDARNNPLRLDKRADWRKTAASPFGICLRGAISEDERKQFWEYRPPYWAEGVIFIHKSNEESPETPLIFVIPSSVRPTEKLNTNRSLFSHRSTSKAIQIAEIAGPNYQWPKISKPQEIVFLKTESPHIKVIVDGKLPNEIRLNDLISIVGVQ